MKNHIAEELPARKHAPAAGGAAPTDKGGKREDSGKSPEQKAKQAVYDIRYRARREDIPLRQAYSQYMQNSSMGQQERAIVKAKLFGKEVSAMKAEDFNPIFKDAASDNVAKALFKVFVEGVKEEEPISLTYLEELDTPEHRKYKVRVTDKNTKRSYVRMATREKINQLRANPNIESVEMTEYGEPYEGERKKGSQTAKVVAGKGLDPVGQEDKDIDNDGDHDKTDRYLLNRRRVRGAAIETRKEEFIHEAETEDSNPKPFDYKKGKVHNKVTVAPEQGKGLGLMAHNELEGEVIVETGYEKFLKKVHSLQEKAVSQNQQQLAGMALAYLRGEMPDASEEVKKMAEMGEKKLRDFAKTKHEGLPEKVKEEMECDSDKKRKNGEEEDPRSMKTKVNLVKNKLRAMGLKMSYEPEGEIVDEAIKGLRPASERTKNAITPAQRKAQELARKRKEELAHQADLALAGMKKTAKPGAVTQSSAKPAAPEANRKLKTGKKVDTLAVKANKIISSSYEPEGEQIDEEMPKRARGQSPSGTRTFTGMGYYGRTQKEKRNPKSMKPIFPEPKEKKPLSDDENRPRRRRYSGSEVD